MAENEKKKLSKGAIAGIVVGSIVVVLLIVVLSVLGALGMFKKSAETPAVPVSDLKVMMYDEADTTGNTMKYYVGKNSEVDLTKAFPGATNFGGTCGVTSDGKIANGKAVDGTLTFSQDGKEVSYKVYAVDAVNAYGDSAETTMREKLGAGVSVVLHGDLTTKDKSTKDWSATFSIAQGATFYGNGNELHADSISAPRDTKKNKNTSWGSHVFNIKDGTALHIQDIHIFVNTLPEGATSAKLDNFEFSGNGIDLVASLQGEGDKADYLESTLTNVVVENGQKLVHVGSTNVTIKGCIFRNSADANIASGTYASKKGSHITIENSVCVNSIVASFLFYGWDDIPADDVYHQQKLSINGFFDMYNWKDTRTAKLVPTTEGIVAKLVNEQVANAIDDPLFKDYITHYDMNKDGNLTDNERFIHIGIIRLSTTKCAGQNPVIEYNGVGGNGLNGAKEGVQPGYAPQLFPIPPWALNINLFGMKLLQNCNMISYEASKIDTLNIKPDTQLTDVIYKEMVYGRK